MAQIFLFLGLVFNLFMILRIDKYLNTNYIFKVFILFSFVNWYLIPIIVSMLGYYEMFEYIINIPISKYYLYANFEIWFLALILLIFFYSTKYKFKRKYEISFIDNENSFKYSNRAFILFSILFLIYNFTFRFDYLEINEIENAEGGFFFLINTISLFIISYFWINIIQNNKDKNNNFFILIVILYITYNIVTGSRIFLIAFIWLFYFINKEKFKKLKYIIIGTILLVTSLLLLPIIASVRVGEKSNEVTFDNTMFNLVIEHLNTKSNGIGYSTVLIEEDGIGFAGINPYIGSFLKFLPRGFWASKPTPTSFNGDISGTPARRVAFLLSGDHGTYNVGISPGLVCLWHGYYSVIISIFINVLFLRLLAFLLSVKSIYMNSLGFLLFYFPQLIMTPSYGDNIIQKVFESFILLVLLIVSKLVIISIKYKNHISLE